MSLRDDFGSGAGRPGGYGGGAGGLGNGGIGGGMGGGGMGGGAGRNGGIGSHTGMMTGNTWYGNTAFGRPGGSVWGYATKGLNGQYGNFRNPNGSWVHRSPAPAAGGRPAGNAPRQASPVAQSPLPATNPNVVPASAPPATYYDPLTSIFGQPVGPNVATPVPTSEYWGVRMARPSALSSAVSAPTGNWNGNKTMSAYSWANDPQLGTSGPGGLGNYVGGPSSLRGWGGWNDPWN